MPPRSSTHSLGGLELIVVVHVGLFLTAATWAFGGNAEFVRPWLALWGTAGALLTIAALMANQRRVQISLRPLGWLWPFGLFNALVAVSCFTPLLRELRLGNNMFFAPVKLPAWRPGAAMPALAWRALWLFDGIYLSCFNLALVVRHRRALRGLLLAAGANALVLSIFGTIQKLLGAKGLFFGLVKSPQIYFFSSFIYHNHWGAFIVLMSAVCLGLVRYYARQGGGRDIFHTPAFIGVVAVLFLAATVPLSTSRSCTLLLVLLLGGGFLHWISGLSRERREFGESMTLPLLGAFAAVVVGIAGIWYIARDVIEMRVAKTEEQIADMRARGDVGGRATLYRDTLRMAEARPWFGWGMGSYPQVFWIYNTQQANPLDHLPVYYHDAHSDWLQAFAEDGLAGASLLGLCAVVPLWSLRQRHLRSPLTVYPLAGCGLILLYAWVEFPFGNMAVVLSWWLCYFCALRYALLEKDSRTTEQADH